MGKGEFWHPTTSKALNFFKFELDFRDYVIEFYTCANFNFNPFSGRFSPDRWHISTVLWLFPSWLYWFFLQHVPRSNPWMDFHGLWLIRRVFAQEQSFWGLRQHWSSFGGNIPKNSPKRGVNTRQFQAKQAKYKNRDILQTINTINVQF